MIRMRIFLPQIALLVLTLALAGCAGTVKNMRVASPDAIVTSPQEGKALVIVGREAAEEVLAAMKAHPLGREAAIIGEVVADHPGKVFLRSRIGGTRVVDMISGEQLPRIC